MPSFHPLDRPRPAQPSTARRTPPTIIDAEPVVYQPLVPRRAGLGQVVRLLLASLLGGLVALGLMGGRASDVHLPDLDARLEALLVGLIDSQRDHARQREALEQELQALRETRLREVEQHNQQLQAQLTALETAQRQAEDAARIRALAQDAAQRLAGDFGGGRDITGAPLAETSWSCNAGQCAILMRASWNGAWIASNHYWVEGTLYIDPQGRQHFQESARSRNLGGE